MVEKTADSYILLETGPAPEGFCVELMAVLTDTSREEEGAVAFGGAAGGLAVQHRVPLKTVPSHDAWSLSIKRLLAYCASQRVEFMKAQLIVSYGMPMAVRTVSA